MVPGAWGTGEGRKRKDEKRGGFDEELRQGEPRRAPAKWLAFNLYLQQPAGICEIMDVTTCWQLQVKKKSPSLEETRILMLRINAA